jgi:adenine/guanine phosphoribosyltransferase-like PRPP-binding protein
LDDVISTGSTLKALRLLMGTAAAQIVAEMAVFTEGDASEWPHVIALGHLPVFSD